MIPFGNETVTLFHETHPGYTRFVLNGCSWRNRNTRSVVDNAVYVSMETVCRIPEGQQAPGTGDLMVRGNVAGDVSGEIELVRLMQKLQAEGHQAFRVQTVKDNTGVPLPHWAATGA